MTEETKRLLDVVLGTAQLLAIITGGVWAYMRFWREGIHNPRIEFGVRCQFLGPVHGSYAAVFNVTAANRGHIEHRFEEIRLRVRGIDALEPLTEWPGYEPMLAFPKELARGANLVPKKFGYYFVRPGVTQEFTYTMPIAASVQFIVARVTFKYHGTDDIHTAEGVFEVCACDKSAANATRSVT
jgi:hypothetical protein